MTQDMARAAQLGNEAWTAHETVKRCYGPPAAKTKIAQALKAGDALNELKALLGHGKWLEIRPLVGVPQAVCARYMKLSRFQPRAELLKLPSLRKALLKSGMREFDPNRRLRARRANRKPSKRYHILTSA